MNLSSKFIVSIIIVVGVFGIGGGLVGQSVYSSQSQFTPIAFADDDNEREDEGDEDEDDDEEKYQTSKTSPSKSTTTTMKNVIQNVTEYKPVVTTVEVTPDEYLKDSDGDLLVDAIDPSPYVKQSEYYTDIDGDGVPNAIDKHHDEDDFAYFDDLETDTNNNGLLDSYEAVDDAMSPTE